MHSGLAQLAGASTRTVSERVGVGWIPAQGAIPLGTRAGCGKQPVEASLTLMFLHTHPSPPSASLTL